MSNTVDKYNIKIPTDISVIYSKKKKTLIFFGPLKTKSMKLKLKIFVDKTKKIISISPTPFSQQISNTEKKKIKTLRHTTAAQIKHILMESFILSHQKMKINGVGYRAFFDEPFNQKLLTLKLGYSHLIYIRIVKNLAINCFTKTKLCVFGNSYKNVSQLSALIRSKKMPEPYKGKGILYEYENITLKEGKKI